MRSTMMSKHVKLVYLGLGLTVGLMLAGLWPNTPLHAVATDRNDTFIMATGPLDDAVEGIYLLDCLTGEMRGAALSRQNGKFNAFFLGNAAEDLKVDPSKTPRYLMVTGMADLNRVGGAMSAPSRAIIYVAEINSGKVGAFAIRWSPAAHARGQPYSERFTLLDTFPMRKAVGGGTHHARGSED